MIIEACESPIIGDGPGASALYGSQVMSGFPEPHNEYLRVWCDTGVLGSVVFWGFIALVASRALGGLRRDGPAVRRRHVATLQLLGAFLILSLTDNPLTTAAFMPAAAFVWGRSFATVPGWSLRLRR